MNLLDQIRKRVFLMDGATGTQIQARAIPPAAWQGKDGCNELLNLTAPDAIRSIHADYFNAGSDAVETNTFGASPLTLGEYGLSDRSFEINRAAALPRPARLDMVRPRRVAMGRSQEVRQRILIPPFPGSNPGAPAKRSDTERPALDRHRP